MFLGLPPYTLPTGFVDCADYTPFLTQVTGYPFYNTSAFTMKIQRNEIDPQRLKMNIIEYFNGFSQDVQDIIDKFKLRQQVDNLTEAVASARFWRSSPTRTSTSP